MDPLAIIWMAAALVIFGMFVYLNPIPVLITIVVLVLMAVVPSIQHHTRKNEKNE